MEFKKISKQDGPYSKFSHNIKGYPESVRIQNSPSNCKLGHMDSISYFLSGIDKDQRKEVFDAALKYAPRLVFLTVSNEDLKDFICNNYDIEYCVSIPYGYNKGLQYHILIRNTEKIGAEYLDRKDTSQILILSGQKCKTIDHKESKEIIPNEEILNIIKDRKYKTTWGMFNGFKKLLNCK